MPEYSFPDKNTSSTNNTNQEQDSLFSGKLNNIDVFVKHEEVLIKKKDRREERELRRINANRAYYFSLGWAIFIAFIVMSNSFSGYFNLSKGEYYFTLGSLTITILTYYLTVIRSLFPTPKEPKSPK